MGFHNKEPLLTQGVAGPYPHRRWWCREVFALLFMQTILSASLTTMLVHPLSRSHGLHIDGMLCMRICRLKGIER